MKHEQSDWNNKLSHGVQLALADLDLALAMAVCLPTEELLLTTASLLDHSVNQRDVPQEVRDRLATLVRELQASLIELRSIQVALDKLGPQLTPSLSVTLAVLYTRLNALLDK